MIDFAKAIQIGIKAAEDKKANMQEIRNVIQDVNADIFEFCGMKNGFMEVGENSIVCNEIIRRFVFDSNYGYPIKIDTYAKNYECGDKEEFIECIKSIVSSATFGNKIRKFRNEI